MLEPESDRKQLEKINQELMVANAEYNELLEKLTKLGEKIFKHKKKINDKLNGKD